MKNFLIKNIKSIIEFVYKHMEQGSGHMILLTSMTGILLSCLAQSGAILLNKKYTNSQKAFMVPQELTEGLLTVLSMFIITKPTQKLAQNLIKTGKVTTKEIYNYMKNNDILQNRGNKGYDLSAEIEKIINDIKKSDIFMKSDSMYQQKLISKHSDILKKYEIFKDAGSAIATTAATMATTALITPTVRNVVAAKSQKKRLCRTQSVDTMAQAKIIKKSLFNI